MVNRIVKARTPVLPAPFLAVAASLAAALAIACAIPGPGAAAAASAAAQESRGQNRQETPSDAGARARFEAQCATRGAPLEECQQIAVELQRRLNQSGPVVATDDDDASPKDPPTRLTEGEQRAAKELRCRLTPGADACRQK